MKIALEKSRNLGGTKVPPIEWKSALPFVENSRGQLVHRPMSVVTYLHQSYPYLAIKYQCGLSACGSKNLTFLSVPPEHAVVCHRCEEFAVLRGLPSSSDIAGRHVHIGGLKVFKKCGCK